MELDPIPEKLGMLRENLKANDAAGIVLSMSTNVDYISGYQSVMDG